MKLTGYQKKILMLALISNYSIYMCIFLFFYPTYESQLDIMMQAALYGVSGMASAHILYMNVILGWILKPLISAMPGVNWYYMYLAMTSVLALSVISYILIKRAGNKIGRTVAFVISCFLGYECYVLPGAMKTAGVVAVALLLLLADSYDMGAMKKSARKIVLLMMAAFGSMVQLSAFLVTLLIGSICLILYYTVFHFEEGTEKWSEQIRNFMKSEQAKHFMMLLGAMFMIVVLLYAVDDFSYRFSGRETAVAYRGTMCRMYGYGIGEYDADVAEQYGIDESGFSSLKTGNFAVQDEQTLEHVRDLVAHSDQWSVAKVNRYFKSVPIGLFKYGIFYLFIIMLFMLFYSQVKRKKAFVWTEIAMLIATTLVEYLFNAWGYNWVAVITVFALILPLMLALKDAKEVEYQYLWVYLVVFSVILYSKFSSGMVSSVAEEDMQAKFASVDTGKCNVIDLNAYLKRFSSQHYYAPGLLYQDSVSITNGAYYLMDGYADKVLTGVDGNLTYEWMYNPYNLDVWGVWLE